MNKRIENTMRIDWREKAEEEQRTLRFCPNCGNLVKIQLKEHKYYQNFYQCSLCGDTVFVQGTILIHQRGYSSRYRQRFVKKGKKEEPEESLSLKKSNRNKQQKTLTAYSKSDNFKAAEQ